MLEVCDEVEVVEDSEMQRLPRRVADHAKVTHATSFRSPESRALHRQCSGGKGRGAYAHHSCVPGPALRRGTQSARCP